MAQNALVFAEPKTRADWKRFREAAKDLTVDDLPGADFYKVEAFRQSLFSLTGNFSASARVSMKWFLLGIAPSLFFQLTERVLEVAQWGAMFHFAAVAFIFIGIFVGGAKSKQVQQEEVAKVLTLGREIGVIK